MNSLCVYKEKIINKTYNTYKPNLDLLSKNLFKAKSGDSASMIFFIEKYQLLIKKYAYAYKLKNYDTDDLIQIGNLSVITAINKYDLTRGAEYIDSYIINSIKNSFKNLARGQIKYNDESSINITINEDIEISDLIKYLAYGFFALAVFAIAYGLFSMAVLIFFKKDITLAGIKKRKMDKQKKEKSSKNKK